MNYNITHGENLFLGWHLWAAITKTPCTVDDVETGRRKKTPQLSVTTHDNLNLVGMEKTMRDIAKIYIFESPSPEDFLNGVQEGEALSKALDLASIENSYNIVTNVSMFVKCLRQIEEDIEAVRGQRITYLHFSMHGNERGIGFTNNEFLTWEQLYYLLEGFSESIGYTNGHIEGHKRALINLQFSVCGGFNAIKMKDYAPANITPYLSVVGPTEKVHWSDSLIAFQVYYHNTLHKTQGIEKAVHLMNDAAGLQDIFKVELGRGITFKKQHSV